MKKVFHKAFAENNTKISNRVNNFFAWLTILSIISVVLETVPELEDYSEIFFWLEWVAVGFFTIEYICRLIVSKPFWRYSTSFFGVVDLLAIVPTFLGLGNLTFLKSARSLRIIRLLRMARLAKVARSGPKTDDLSVASLNILIYFSVLLVALLVTGTAMYLVEPELVVFSSIPTGMWWSFKVFLASIPVVQPETVLGEVFYVITRFTGLLMLGLLVGVVGNIFKSVLLKDEK